MVSPSFIWRRKKGFLEKMSKKNLPFSESSEVLLFVTYQSISCSWFECHVRHKNSQKYLFTWNYFLELLLNATSLLSMYLFKERWIYLALPVICHLYIMKWYTYVHKLCHPSSNQIPSGSLYHVLSSMTSFIMNHI